jgi:hypothetical protein
MVYRRETYTDQVTPDNFGTDTRPALSVEISISKFCSLYMFSYFCRTC